MTFSRLRQNLRTGRRALGQARPCCGRPSGEGPGKGAQVPEPGVPARGDQSSQDLGLRCGPGAPPRGFPTWPFPLSVSDAPAATCSVLGTPSGAFRQRPASPWAAVQGRRGCRAGRGAPATGTCGADCRARSGLVKGSGPGSMGHWAHALRWVLQETARFFVSGFLPLILLLFP